MAAQTSTKPTPPTNGDARGPLSHATDGKMAASAPVNRKKQKRRLKQAARAAADSTDIHASADLELTPDDQHSNGHDEASSADLDHAEADDVYHNGVSGSQPDLGRDAILNEYDEAAGSKSKKKKHKKGRSRSHTHADDSPTSLPTHPATYPHQPSSHALPCSSRFPAKSKESSIWNQSSLEERENIRTFWFELGEEERRQLVKVEKDAVLKKMKEQQRHSCSCTVCGRKRTAIEEELEVLYDAYYEELEQYANNNQGSFEEGAPIIPPPRLYQSPLRSPGQHTRTHGQYHPSRGRVEELSEDEEEEEEEDDEDDENLELEEDFDDDEEDDDEEDELYSEEEFEDDERTSAARADLFAFGNSLTVKDGILTVADDLLKNDGKHFIDMMEQLAERRMQREEDPQFNISTSHQSFHAGHNHGPLDDDEDYDDEEDEDYDSQEEEEFDEDEMDAMTEEQRMQEGRRMFQIFAARMFEQRVMTAYREKVAEERQKQLLNELIEEENRNEQRNAKKAREAQKKKDKKRLQKQAKEEERARREAEKAAEEAAAKAAHEKKLEVQRLKREEQRKKREAERKAQEEERARKDAEKQRRIKEDRERQAEAERKQREQKEEKKRREEAKRKEKEERDKKAKEDHERKVREEQVKKDQEDAAKGVQEGRELSEVWDSQAKPPQNPPLTSLPSTHPSSSQPPVPPPVSLHSPTNPLATPLVPKASTPVRPRQLSHQGSYSSSPHSQPSSSDMFPYPPSVSPRSMAQSHSGTAGGRPGPGQAPYYYQQQQPPLHHPQPSAPVSPLGRSNHPGFSGFGAVPSNPPGLPVMGEQSHMSPDLPMYSPNSGMVNPLRTGFPASGGITAPPGINPVRPMPTFPRPDVRSNLPFPVHYGVTGVYSPQQVQQLKQQQQHEHQLKHQEQQRLAQKYNANASRLHQQPASQFPLSTLNQSTDQSLPATHVSPIRRPSSGTQDQYESGRTASHQEVEELSTHLGSSALLDNTDNSFQSNLSQSLPGVSAPSRFPPPSRASFQGQSFVTEPLSPQTGAAQPGTAQLGSSQFGIIQPGNINTGPGGWGGTYNAAAPYPTLSTWGTAPGKATPYNQLNPNTPFTKRQFGGSRPPLVDPLDPFAAIPYYRVRPYRPVTVRLLVIEACNQLTTESPNSLGFHSANTLLARVEQVRHPLEPHVSMTEMLDICDTEGNAQNGGGLFHVKHSEGVRFIKFEPDMYSLHPSRRTSVAPGPGDIGSPVQMGYSPTSPSSFSGYNANTAGHNAAAANPAMRQYPASENRMYGGSP
ncbi:hypothetical protein N7488_000624 [Penicillium malachiteum]|nr:hypothetical protein N7488_000624 [Penicillium malachiteum]